MRNLALFALIVILAFTSLTAFASAQQPVPVTEYTVTLPYFNTGGITTSIVIDNLTDKTVELTKFWNSMGFGAGIPFIAPFETFSFKEWARPGYVGARNITLPLGTRAYVEFALPTGELARIPAITQTSEPVQLHGFKHDAAYRSAVWLTAPDNAAAVVTVTDVTDDGAIGTRYTIAAGETVAAEVKGTHAFVAPVDSTVYVLGYVVQDKTGVVHPVEAFPLQ
jgi:hypothetical protein